MMRLLIFACLAGPAYADKWGNIERADQNKKGYCYGYLTANAKEYCWLTSDGEKDFVKEGTGGYSCSDYDSYAGVRYCEGAQTEAKALAAHKAKNKVSPVTLGVLKGCKYNDKKYCFGTLASDPEKWCWLTSDGLKDFVSEGTGGHACSSYDGHGARTYCENAKSASDATLHVHSPAKPPKAYGIDTLIEKIIGTSSVDCKPLCTYFGSSGYRSSWSSSGSTRMTTCTCGSQKIIKVECSRSTPFSHCSLDSMTGSGTPAPPPAPPAPPGLLHGFIAKFATDRAGTKVSRRGSSSTECWDLPMAAIQAANRQGFNVGEGHSGGSGWVWSNNIVHYTQAKPGDIAQFVSWSEKVTTAHGWSSKGTGNRHSAVVTGAYDPKTCGIETYDQNPSPTKKNVYHPCKSAGYKSGSMIIYRMTSMPRGDRLYSVEAPQMELSTPFWAIGCGMAAAMVSLGLVAWRTTCRLRQPEARGAELLNTEDSDPETPEE